MGEIANDMIHGNACPCGEYFENEGDGFPRYCSSVCERDYGGGHKEVKNPRYKGVDEYRGDMDDEFLKAHDVEIIKHQPWQFSLKHPDLKGKFVWYPRKGTLMFEPQVEHGSFTSATKIGEYTNTEKVYSIIMDKINQQQNNS